jgi:hypothetical protein
MKTNNHIITLLETSSLRALSESQVTSIEEHISTCTGCREAYRAAQISSSLLEIRAAEKVEPSAFFETRVLAHVRELRTTNEGWGLLKLWRAAGALGSSMVATVVVLGVLTLALPAEQNLTSQEISTNRVSAEAVILNQTEFQEELASDGQVLRTLYGAEEDAVR